jgi:predicted nucleotidyltransferase
VLGFPRRLISGRINYPLVKLTTFNTSSNNHLEQEVVRRILGVKHPAAIVLFGSQSRGETHTGSDLDILIIERENPLPRHRRASAYRMAMLGIDCDIDMVVYTPEEIEDWAAVPNAFITTALREGRLLYEDGRGLGQRLAGQG